MLAFWNPSSMLLISKFQGMEKCAVSLMLT